MSTLQHDDQAARIAAVNPAHSVIVQAPAGSGKTTLLVERYLGLLSIVDEPEEILAITFTRKAAAEMKQRILRFLDPDFKTELPHEQSSLNKARQAETHVQQWKLRQHPQRMQIRTIDSFNQYLVRSMPVASRLGPIPSPTENTQRLYQTAARRVLALIESDPDCSDELSDDIRRLLSWRDHQSREIEDLLAELLAKREQWLRVLGPSETPERDYLQQRMQRLVERDLLAARTELVSTLAQANSGPAELVALLDHAARTLNAEQRNSKIRHCEGLTQLPAHRVSDLDTWQGLVELLLISNKPAYRQKISIRNGFEAKSPEKEHMLQLLQSLSAFESLAETLNGVRQLPCPEYADADWQTLASLIRVMQRCALELQLVFAEQAQCDFAALGEAALRGLGTDQNEVTDLRLYLDQRIQHILVDEFQDTNFSQFQLIEQLTAGWTNDDGRSVFLVGDPMQSIYRFREAEVGLFMRARNHGLNRLSLKALKLDSNYRSSPAIVDWVNQKLGPIFPEQEDTLSGAVTFEPSSPAVRREGRIDTLATADRPGEAEAIVSLIEQQQAHTKSADHRSAIIVRSRGHLSELLPALRKAGIRYRAVKLDPLVARPVVQDLLAITRAILNPADRTAHLAILRSPLAGLDLSDLDRLAGRMPSDDTGSLIKAEPGTCHPFGHHALKRLSRHGHPRAERVFDVLARAQSLWRRRNIRDLVEGAWHALYGPSVLPEPGTDLQDAADYLAFLQTAEQEGWIDDQAVFEERLEGEHSGSHIEQPDDPPSDLEILTMHSAKGLEWDWVILPGLDRIPRGRTTDLLNWLPYTDTGGRERVVLAPLRAASEAEHSPIVQFILNEQKTRDRLESQRLLYVAATRARQRLTLSACLDPERKDPAPAASSLLAEFWPYVKDSFCSGRMASKKSIPVGRTLPDQSLRRIAPGWQSDRPPNLESDHPVRMNEREAEIEFNWAGIRVRRIGTVIHRLLERVGQRGVEHFHSSNRSKLIQRIPILLQALGTAERDLAESTEIVRHALDATLEDSVGRWILSNRHTQSACELAVSGELDGILVNAVIDRTFVDQDQCRWIIDYKSGFHAGGDLDVFLQQEVMRYRDQLDRYARLFKQMGEQQIRTALYFPRHQVLQECLPEPA